MQAYSDPKRESDPHALPDVEVWEDRIYELLCERCGKFDITEGEATATSAVYCPSCEREATAKPTMRFAWWWWSCFPGCLPDSKPFGPFETEADALADAREGVE